MERLFSDVQSRLNGDGSKSTSKNDYEIQKSSHNRTILGLENGMISSGTYYPQTPVLSRVKSANLLNSARIVSLNGSDRKGENRGNFGKARLSLQNLRSSE